MNPNTDFLPFARPAIGKEEEEAVLEVLRSGWLTTGKVARAFEEEFASFVGSKRALAVNSATSGLHLAMEALGLGAGKLVVTSPYTFASTAAVARHLGAEVRFCDIGKDDYNIDPGLLEAILEKEKGIGAVVPVHVGGNPCDMGRIGEACRKAGVGVIEDAAHAFPSRTAEGYAGSLGDIGVYSFYATKTITTGEGGMVVSDDEALLKRMGTMRMHGFDREAWDRYTSRKASWYYEIIEAGYKYNLPDLLAAIGRVQLAKAESLFKERMEIARRYDEAFSRIDGLILPPRKNDGSHAWHLYALRVEGRGEEAETARDSLVAWLSEEGIGTSVHFIPLHLMPYWAGRYALKPSDFPEAWASYRSSVSLPIWPGMGEEAIGRVVDAVSAWARGRRAA
ncbi:MAG TPA: DegT/DnrJ/EryC1/StrS family aminotransferase [Rectinemataceae bacterium]|nr:DegT/DnrJ/EryC1/StrS family aminotransferase [Rectinemataceae bacterium]